MLSDFNVNQELRSPQSWRHNKPVLNVRTPLNLEEERLQYTTLNSTQDLELTTMSNAKAPKEPIEHT